MNEDKHLRQLQELDGYYERRELGGRRYDPLVGYAGRDEEGRQYVGDVYVNFAVVEERPTLLNEMAGELYRELPLIGVAGFCGAPEGGKALAVLLALKSGRKYIFPEERVLQIATSTSRKISEFFFGRHQPKEGEVWWIVEDVCNNFSTTEKLIALIESFGAKVEGIVCFLNRSVEVDKKFTSSTGESFSVVSLVRKPFGQYRQDDPAVVEDIAAGRVVWKPKDKWGELKEAQQRPIVIPVDK